MPKSIIELDLDDNFNVSGCQVKSLNINGVKKYNNIDGWAHFTLLLFNYLYEKYSNDFVNKIMDNKIPLFTNEQINNDQYKISSLYFNLPTDLTNLFPWVKRVFNLFDEPITNITFEVIFENTLTIIGDDNPSEQDQSERDKKGLCQYCEENCDGEMTYVCQNKTNPFTFKYEDITISIWLKNGMLCSCHLKKLSEKYKIDFSSEIPKSYLDKGWFPQLPNKFDKDQSCCKNLLFELQNTKLYKSLNKNLPINQNEGIYQFINPEQIWFRLPEMAMEIPKKLWDSLTYFESTLKHSSSQGEKNGPDFIFKNDNNESIGLEIVSFPPNITHIVKEKEFLSHANNKVYNITSLEDKKIALEKILDEKEEKSKNYTICKELYLGIVVVGDILMPYEYFILELIINKINKEKKYNFKEIFFI